MQLPDDLVHRLLAHQAVGGKLAARDIPPERLGVMDLVGARYVRRLATRVRHQRPQPGPRANHIPRDQLRRREELVRYLQHITDVRGVRPHVVYRPVVIGIRRPENRPFAPGDGEEDALAFGHDHCLRHRHPGVIHHEVNALGRAQLHVAVRQAVGPRPGRVHHGPGAHFERVLRQAVLQIAFPNLRPRRALEAAVIEDAGPALRRRAQRINGQPRIVREAVVVPHRPFEPRGAQARHALQHFGLAQPRGLAQVAPAAEQVVDLHADLQLPQHPVPVAAIGREDERQRVRQVRRDVMNHLLLDARLAHQADAALGQVAQPAVQQPARTAARAEGKVVLLDQPDPQPAHRRIPGDARADDAAADNEHVQRLLF